MLHFSLATPLALGGICVLLLQLSLIGVVDACLSTTTTASSTTTTVATTTTTTSPAAPYWLHPYRYMYNSMSTASTACTSLGTGITLATYTRTIDGTAGTTYLATVSDFKQTGTYKAWLGLQWNQALFYWVWSDSAGTFLTSSSYRNWVSGTSTPPQTVGTSAPLYYCAKTTSTGTWYNDVCTQGLLAEALCQGTKPSPFPATPVNKYFISTSSTIAPGAIGTAPTTLLAACTSTSAGATIGKITSWADQYAANVALSAVTPGAIVWFGLLYDTSGTKWYWSDDATTKTSVTFSNWQDAASTPPNTIGTTYLYGYTNSLGYWRNGLSTDTGYVLCLRA